MARFSKYSIIRLETHPARDERLNVGLVVFKDDGLDIRIGRKLEKVRALSGALDLVQVRENILQLENVDRLLREQGMSSADERRDTLEGLGFVSLSKIALIDSTNMMVYEAAIHSLLTGIVEPEQAPLRVQPKRTRLISAVKQALKQERILGRAGDELSEHRVVPHVQLAEGLVADFVLKNGSMHVVETIDAAVSDVSPRKIVTDIALSALVLEQARISYGDSETRAKLIYDASASIEAIAMPSLYAAAHQGAELVNWQSRDDRNRFLSHLASLAIPFEVKSSGGKTHYIASTQRKLDLN